MNSTWGSTFAFHFNNVLLALNENKIYAQSYSIQILAMLREDNFLGIAHYATYMEIFLSVLKYWKFTTFKWAFLVYLDAIL